MLDWVYSVQTYEWIPAVVTLVSEAPGDQHRPPFRREKETTPRQVWESAKEFFGLIIPMIPLICSGLGYEPLGGEPVHMSSSTDLCRLGVGQGLGRKLSRENSWEATRKRDGYNANHDVELPDPSLAYAYWP